MHILSLVTDNNHLESAYARRMAVEIIAWSSSTKVWNWAGIKLVTPGSFFYFSCLSIEQNVKYALCSKLQLRVCNRKIFFIFLNQNICCGYSKEPSLPWDGKSYLSHVILPSVSWEDCSLVVLDLTHMVVKWCQCLVKVTSSCDIASLHIQGLLESYFKIKSQ